jgi:hypothetical protein
MHLYDHAHRSQTVRLEDTYGGRYGVRFRQECAREDAIGSHACSLEAIIRVTNDIPLGRPPPLAGPPVKSAQTLKV